MPRTRRYQDTAEKQRAYRERRKIAQSLTQSTGISCPPSRSNALSTTRWRALSKQAEDLLQQMKQQMETYFDQRSEAWQEAEKGEEFQKKIDRVQEAIQAIEDID